MTKLSERMPDTNYDRQIGGRSAWLKELAEYVEFIDGRAQVTNSHLREQLNRLLDSTQEEKEEAEYEPQTYDEAIALCKGWKRCVVDMFVHWETPKGAWWMIDPNDNIGFCEADYENYNFSWERDKWPELWKEMTTEDCFGHLYFQEDRWVLYFPTRYEDSTPGRVVCKAYLVYKGHSDWAERLSKNG